MRARTRSTGWRVWAAAPLRGAIVLSATAFLAIPALASTIDMITFESRPDGSTPLDDEIISLGTQYTTANGVAVRFGFDSNNDGIADLPAAFEDTLDKPAFGTGAETEYAYCSSNYGSHSCSTDQAAPGYEDRLGDFLIRQSGPVGTHWDSFIIEYDALAPVTAASGEIWDIDRGSAGKEGFTVSVYGDTGAVLATQSSPRGLFEHNPDSLDAKPWAWQFSGLSDIAKIVFTRDTGSGMKDYSPLGFDNFNPTSASIVPEPSTFLLLALGLTGLAMSRRV